MLVVQVAALVAGAIILERSDPRVMLLTLLALACVAAAQVLFWTFTCPANAATAHWTVMPDDWESLRARWEFSHAAGALLQLVGFCLLTGAVLARGRRHSSRSSYYF